MIALTGVCIAMMVKQWKSDFLPLVRLGLALLCSLAALSLAAPVITFAEELTESNALSEHAEPLFKALGIGILAQCCAQICRECGESGVASGVELVGKAEILLLCLPLVSRLLETVKELLALGGPS